jgi:glycosyltransferase involved in cell wall biosynthesis
MNTSSGKGRILSFHPRRQHNFEQAAGLAELYPEEFTHVTGVYTRPLWIRLLKRIAPRYASFLGKRSYSKLSGKFVRTLLSTEIRRFLQERKQELGPADYMDLNEHWQRNVLRHFDPPEVCISYDSISHLLFREWKNKSKLILDLTIGLPQYRIKIMHGNRFENSMLEEQDEVRKRLFAIYREEVELADLILCGSEFTKKTVVYFYPEFENKCKVVPYGADLEKFKFPQRQFPQKENLRFVFVGRLSWRKGADLMLDAWKDFVISHPQAELHFFGIPDREINVDQLPPNCFVHGWTGTAELIDYLKSMDVFVFPTTFEGSSYAIYQAMALKLPVITTLNSGTVLTPGESCEIVEVGDKTGLLNAMDKLFQDPEYRQKLAERAYALSGQYSWNDYKIRLEETLRKFFMN